MDRCEKIRARKLGRARANSIRSRARSFASWPRSLYGRATAPTVKRRGYAGGYTILKEFVPACAPGPAPAFLTLHFAPGQAAQVDWAAPAFWWWPHPPPAFFFVMCSATAARCMSSSPWRKPRNTSWPVTSRLFEYFHGVTSEIMVDNCKRRSFLILRAPAVPHPRYLDFARIRLCHQGLWSKKAA